LAEVGIPASAFDYNVAQVISFFWPLFPQQYAAVKSSGTNIDAGNFVLFFVILILYHIIIGIRLLVVYWKQFYVIKGPALKELAALVVCMPGVVYALKYDTVLNASKPFWNFYVDSYGLYYLRQAMLFHIVYIIAYADANFIYFVGIQCYDKVQVK